MHNHLNDNIGGVEQPIIKRLGCLCMEPQYNIYCLKIYNLSHC